MKRLWAIIGASALIAGILAIAFTRASGPDGDQRILTDAIENLEAQAAKLAAQPGASCPQDFSALEAGRTLRIALFYGSDEHDGRVHGRTNAGAMMHVLTEECRGRLSVCGFSVVARSLSTVSLQRTIAGRTVEVNLFTSAPEPEEEGSVKERFYRELVESDVVFYMGHSHLGGDIGFDAQAGITTIVNSVLRVPMRPVLEALRRRPTRLKMIGMFSCESSKYFRQDFESANPALSLILTTGDIDYGPAEQTSLGALEAVLSQSCGHAFRESLISASESDRSMTYVYRGRQTAAPAPP